MEWEIYATWAGLLVSVGGLVFKMGELAQKVRNQQQEITELKQEVKETKETPVKLATLETDIKYLVQEITTIKTILMQRK